MGLLNVIAEKLLKNFLSLKKDDWIEERGCCFQASLIYLFG